MDNRVDERVSARLILSCLVVITLGCGLLVTVLTYTRLDRASRIASAYHEADLLAKSAALILNLGEDDKSLSENLRKLESLFEASSLSNLCARLESGIGKELVLIDKSNSCSHVGLARVFANGGGESNVKFRLSVEFKPEQKIISPHGSTTAYRVYTFVLIIVFSALILVLIYLAVGFGHWIFDELHLTISGRRDAPPAILQSLRIIELEKVWETVDRLGKATRNKVLVDITTRVAHDIRSPLSALNMVVGTLCSIPEPKRLLIRNATNRINDIANDLVKQGKIAKAFECASTVNTLQTKQEPVMLVALVDSVVSEKRLQYRERSDLDIIGDFDSSYGIFATVDAAELARSISNLIDNSVQAISGSGKILIGISGTNHEARISICDDGCGIPSEMIAQVGVRGFSSGKAGSSSGLGLGVCHAREMAEQAGGRLTIHSKLGDGTFITILLPRAESPSWFLEQIDLTREMAVISIDDDQTIHQVWAGRFAALDIGLRHLKFTSLNSFSAWMAQGKPVNAQYLFDQEFLGQDSNGLRIIDQHNIHQQTILVTSHFDDKSFRESAGARGLRILPKTLVGLVPISTVERCNYEAN